MKRYFVYLAVMMGVLSACHQRDMVLSPKGNIALSFALNNAGQPTYSVQRDGKDILLPSPMGFTLLTETGDTLPPTSWQVLSTDTHSCDTTWETVWGEERFIRDHHNELIVHLITNHQSPITNHQSPIINHQYA